MQQVLPMLNALEINTNNFRLVEENELKHHIQNS